MRVLSKSKNAPICEPDSPSMISLVKLSVFEPGTISRSMGTEGVCSMGFERIIPCKVFTRLAISSSKWIKWAISSVLGLSSVGIKLRFLINRMPLIKNTLETASMRLIRPCQCISSPRKRQELSNVLSFSS